MKITRFEDLQCWQEVLTVYTSFTLLLEFVEL